MPEVLSDPEPLVVLVDSSILERTQCDFNRGDWPALAAAARRGLIRLVVPAVVVAEVVAHRQREAEKLMKDWEKIVERGHRFGISIPEESGDIAFHGPKQGTALRSRVESFFGEHGSVAEHPEVGHGELVERILEKRAPFSEGEKGYRDALIWFTTLEIAALAPVLLLTGNTKDFCAESGVTHPDLVGDLRSRGLVPDRVRIATSTSAALASIPTALSDIGSLEALKTHLRSGLFLDLLNEWLSDSSGVEIDQVPVALAPNMWRVCLTDVDSIETIEPTAFLAEDNGFIASTKLYCSGHIGADAWWRAELSDGPWAHWSDRTPGGYFEQYRSEAQLDFEVEITGVFHPPDDLRDAEIVSVSCALRKDGEAGARPFVRQLTCLLAEVETLLSDAMANHDQYQSLFENEDYVGALFTALDEIQPALSRLRRNFPALSPDNLDVTLSEAAGLSAIVRDLRHVIRELD